MAGQLESDLYEPLKQHLEELGFTVRAEVKRCDIVAKRDDLLIAVEMKVSFGLNVLYQALERLSAVDLVYVAVGVPDGSKARENWDLQVPKAERLCRMLGIGMISVRDGLVITHNEPSVYQSRKFPKARSRILSEFTRRSGDYNVGGTTKRPKITAYREDALRIAYLLDKNGTLSLREVRQTLAMPKSTAILRRNVYEWWSKDGSASYKINLEGKRALEQYANVVRVQQNIVDEEQAVNIDAEEIESFKM